MYNRMYKVAILFLVIIATVTGGYIAYDRPSTNDPDVEVPTPRPSTAQPKLISIEEFVTTNISALSPIKETMGGTFYVTEIEIEPEENKGKVKYEDGHSVYEAEFTYISNDRTGHSITSFVIR